MNATMQMVPLAEIRPSGDNPRQHFDEERMAELVQSVQEHGIISPLRLRANGEGGYEIVAGERRYRAAKLAKLTEVPAVIAENGGLAVAVAENVIRHDLDAVEEARAYRQLLDEHGDPAKVAKLVGRSERLVTDRLALLTLPEEAQTLLAARSMPLACAPALGEIAAREPLLARLTAMWLSERPQEAAVFPDEPAEVVDRVLATAWQDETGKKPLYPVAYSVGGYGGPTLPHGQRGDRLTMIVGKLGKHGRTVKRAYSALPEIAKKNDGYDWEADETEQRRFRDCFALDQPDTDAARAFGCLLELRDADDQICGYVTDPEWLADRLTQRIAAHVLAEEERKQRKREQRQPAGADDGQREERREQRQRDYDARLSARARNLDLGAALARWQPKLDTDAAKLLGTLVLHEYGRSAAWAHRLCVEQPTTTNKRGTVTVRYPRGGEAEQQHEQEALRRLLRARTPEDALAVVLRLLVAQHLADTSGLANADRQGISEPSELEESKLLAKLARRVAPPTVRRHLAERQAEEARREQAWQDEQAAQLAKQREQLAAGKPVRCECCLKQITSSDDATEKHGLLVHRGDCEQQWDSAAEDDPAADLEEAA